MKHNKKAFTVVELVIVIAIVAILAAVLIPTFTSIVKKANEANARAEAKNLITEMLANILLGEDGDADLLVFSEKGSDVYTYAYSRSEGRVISYKNNPREKTGTFEDTVKTMLTEMVEDGAITDRNVGTDDWRHPDKIKEIVSNLNTKNNMIVYANYDVAADKFAVLTNAIAVTNQAELTNAIKIAEAGDTIRLDADITATSAISISKELTIDLNGHTLSGSAYITLKLTSGADLTIVDNSADATGVITNTYSKSADPITVDLYGKDAVFTLKSGKVESSSSKDDLYSVAIGSSKKVVCTINIYGGTVANPDGHVKSRAITASNGTTLNLYDGVISGGSYALDVYEGSVSNIYGGKLEANAKDGRSDEYGTTYAVHAKGEATITVGSATLETVPNVKGIKFEANGVKTALPTIKLVKGEITNPVYSMEAKYNYALFKLDIAADAPVTFVDNTANFFLADTLQMVQDGSVWKVTSK